MYPWPTIQQILRFFSELRFLVSFERPEASLPGKKYHSITPFHSDPTGTYMCYFVPVLSASGEKQAFFLQKKSVNELELLQTLAHQNFRS